MPKFRLRENENGESNSVTYKGDEIAKIARIRDKFALEYKFTNIIDGDMPSLAKLIRADYASLDEAFAGAKKLHKRVRSRITRGIQEQVDKYRGLGLIKKIK